ncbi:hypothetical protein LY78DRAFT_91100 [Colletotrichum sublineola]|uniref:Uncharacterized protein n=1 Tax=Colletotrichum sublineola TaxID=1173701 RepID=A0A066X087_COLSU|nr:hypothetical protein LY78DRAFT_91100 [Colletotrichum sublineola]KDN61084.1 hypothetical protein CSUB01_07037 [Colletotrichum sublineola]
MFALVQTLLDFNSHVTLFQRMMFLVTFCFSGIILAVQASQIGEDDRRRIQWTRLTDQTRPYWYTFYVTQVFLFVSGAYPMLHDKMTMYIGSGYEEQILNIIWVGLLSVEALMVAGVAGIAITRKFKGSPKQKTN